MRLEVHTAIHIPEGYRLSFHAMAGLMNMNSECLYKLNDNMSIVCDSGTFDSLEAGTYHIVGVEYEGHMYDYDVESSYKENVILSPISMWDEYTEWVEVAI